MGTQFQKGGPENAVIPFTRHKIRRPHRAPIPHPLKPAQSCPFLHKRAASRKKNQNKATCQFGSPQSSPLQTSTTAAAARNKAQHSATFPSHISQNKPTCHSVSPPPPFFFTLHRLLHSPLSPQKARCRFSPSSPPQRWRFRSRCSCPSTGAENECRQFCAISFRQKFRACG